MDENTVVPSPVQKTMFIGFPSERNAPFAKSPRVEPAAEVDVSNPFPFRASRIAPEASFNISNMPMMLRIIFATLFCTRNASPLKAMIAQVVSPTSEPNCTNNAGTNPWAVPRRTASAVMTPGGAQNAMARMKDEKKRDIIS